MPKADNKTEAKPADALQIAAAAGQEEQQPPRLGETIHVRVAEGMSLINNETGQEFEPEVATPQTVTVTTLRRLTDGDLVRV